MPTHCKPPSFVFQGFQRRRVTAAFDGGSITSNGERSCSRSTASSGSSTGWPRASPIPRPAAQGARPADHAGAAHHRHRPGPRGPQRPRRSAARPAAPAGRHARGTPQGVPARARCSVSNTRPPAASPAATTGSTTIRRRCRRCSWSCSSSCGRAGHHRGSSWTSTRPTTRCTAAPSLRLLRPPLLPAAVHHLRGPPAPRPAQARQLRSRRRGDRGARPRHRPAPPGVAPAEGPGPCRLRLCPRGTAGLVRGQPGGLRRRRGEERHREDRLLADARAEADRQAARHAGSPSSPTPRGRAGRGGGGSSPRPNTCRARPTPASSSPRCPPARSRPAPSTSACPRGDMENTIKERSSISSPTGPRRHANQIRVLFSAFSILFDVLRRALVHPPGPRHRRNAPAQALRIAASRSRCDGSGSPWTPRIPTPILHGSTPDCEGDPDFLQARSPGPLRLSTTRAPFRRPNRRYLSGYIRSYRPGHGILSQQRP